MVVTPVLGHGHKHSFEWLIRHVVPIILTLRLSCWFLDSARLHVEKACQGFGAATNYDIE
jgi:hypothetical protein